MEFEVKTEYLKKVISSAARITSNKVIQPILNNVLLSCENGSLKVQATDLDMAVECRLPVEISKPGRITLPAKKLDEIVSRIQGENIVLKIDKNNLTNIRSSTSKFQINGVSSEEYPNLTEIEKEEKGISINRDMFLSAISLTTFAVSRFDTTSVLSGINFEIREGEFEVGATDGSRLARYIGKVKGLKKLKGSESSVVIPQRAMEELEKLIRSFKEGNEEVFIYFKPGQVIFSNNDFLLSTRLIDSKFPAYDKLIPKEQKYKVKLHRGELLSALERVAVLSNERTNVVKMELKKGKSTLKLNANSPDYGNATDEISADYTGDDIEVAFNYRYLTEMLRNLDQSEISLELESSLSPVLLRLDGEAFDYTYLVMPVQLR